MKIAVLEWVCGGGLADSHLDGSLATEGGAMLGALAKGFSQGGHRVSAPVDRRLAATSLGLHLRRWAELTEVDCRSEDELIVIWQSIATACDVTIVVAPEIDGALERTVESLRALGIPLINCQSDFLKNACSKLATAQRFASEQIAHPPTCELESLTAEWLKRHRQPALGRPPEWVLKPQDGAGGEGLRLLTDAEATALLASQPQRSSEAFHGPSASKILVQPRIVGLPASCSAIVDRDAVCHWLPLISQDFEPSAPRQASLDLGKYRGFTLPPTFSAPAPRALLEASIAALGPGALGWVGIDLIFQPATGRWTVIEVNPRLTTSFVGLDQAYRGNLTLELLRAFAPQSPAKFHGFRSGNFRLDTLDRG